MAGVGAGVDGKYGTIDDHAGAFSNASDIFSRIGSIVIKGRALGTVGGADGFGFSTQTLGAVTVGAVKLPLRPRPGTNNVNFVPDSLRRVAATGDFFRHKVPIAM